MRIGVVILSRFDSNRLPGKALLEVGGKPVLGHVLSFCRKIDGVSQIVLATSDRDVDDPLENFANLNDIVCVRGSLENVAKRFLLAMKTLDCDAAIRVNGDSPLINAELISDCVARFKSGNYDLVSNVPERTYPYGMSVEVVSRNAMALAVEKMRDIAHMEHVTKYFYDNQDEFKIDIVNSGNPNFSGIRLSIDTRDDFERVSWLFDRLECDPTDSDIDTLVALAKAYDVTS